MKHPAARQGNFLRKSEQRRGWGWVGNGGDDVLSVWVGMGDVRQGWTVAETVRD